MTDRTDASWIDRHLPNGGTVSYRRMTETRRGRFVICDEAGDPAYRSPVTGSKIDLICERQKRVDGRA